MEFGPVGTTGLRHCWVQALLIEHEPDSQIIRANVTAENINDLFAAYDVYDFDFCALI